MLLALNGWGKGSAEHPTRHRISSHNKEFSSPKCQQGWGWETIPAMYLCSLWFPEQPFYFQILVSFDFLDIVLSSFFLTSYLSYSSSSSLSFPNFLFHFIQFLKYQFILSFVPVPSYPLLLEWTLPFLWLHCYPIQLIPKWVSLALTCCYNWGLN